MPLHPVILAGGSGTRLWPLSRETHPKQFLRLLGEHSLFQDTVRRMDGMAGVADPLIICNEEHRFLVAEHLRQLGKDALAIALEPVGRNTAPALTLAALMLLDEDAGFADGDPVMLVLPADHVVRDKAQFQRLAEYGAAQAQKGAIVTFGIPPNSPQTGYGYIGKGKPHPSEPAASPDAADAASSGAVSAGAVSAGAVSAGAVSASAASPDAVSSFHIAEFVEKPNKHDAKRLLASGAYLWNSGMFMMRASVWLRELRRRRPDIADSCVAAHAALRRDGEFYRPDATHFAACPAESIDYAVMEYMGEPDAAKPCASNSDASAPDTSNPDTDANNTGSTAAADSTNNTDKTDAAAVDCLVLPMDIGWTDLGAWSSLWEEMQRDGGGNIIQGDVYARAMSNSLVISRRRLVAAVGLKDVILIETPDAVLAAHKERVQEVKELVEQLKSEERPEQENHLKINRPWGSFETVDAGERFQVKRLTIAPGEALSLQMHHHRAEHWVVVKGTAKVTRGSEVFLLTENQSAYVPVGVEHRLENPGALPLEVVEVQTGSYLEEDDIVRFEDRYDRHLHDEPPRFPIDGAFGKTAKQN